MERTPMDGTCVHNRTTKEGFDMAAPVGAAAALTSATTFMNASGPLPAQHGIVIVDASGGDIVVTLPLAAAGAVGVVIQQVDNSTNTVTVNCQGSDTFAVVGETSLVLTAPNTCISIVADQSGNSWLVTSAESKISLAATLAATTGFVDGTVQSTSAAASNINCCLVYCSTSQNLPTQSEGQASFLKVSFDTVLDQNTSPAYNDTPFWNASTPTYLTTPAPGYYLVNYGFSVAPAPYAVGQITGQLFKTGYPGGEQTCFAQMSQPAQTGFNASYNGSAIIACVAGDQIWFDVYQSCGGTVEILGGVSGCWLQVALLAGGGD
jgi:hypothetical protein